MAIKIPSQAVIDKAVRELQLGTILGTMPSYVAASVYTLPTANLTRVNLYDTKEKALQQLYYLEKVSGAKMQNPVGYVSLQANGTPQTVGVNVDFYFPAPYINSFPVPYYVVKELFVKNELNYFIIRLTTPKGNGPYYAILSAGYFGITATKLDLTGQKLAEAKAFYENLALIRTQYNELVATLNNLIAKPVNPVTQQTINRLTQRRITMLDQIRQIKGITIISNDGGSISGIGFIPVALIVALAIVGVAGYSLTTWIAERQKTQRIKDAYNHQTYMTAEQKRIMDACAAGTYPKEQCDQALKNIGVAIQTAQKVAEESAKEEKGLMGNLGNIAMWLAIAVIGSKVIGK
jgi:hypothetical protein